MDPYISVVIPVYNGRRSLPQLHQRLQDVLQREHWSYEVILVDDGSQDNSFQVMQSLRAVDPRVRIIRLQGNFGQHAATLCGLHFCQGEIIVTMDDDLQHPPEEVPRLLAHLQQGYEAVFGIPLQKRHAPYRNWGSRIIHKCLQQIYPQHAHVYSSSFRILRKDLVQKLLAGRFPGQVYLAALIFSRAQRLGNVTVQHNMRAYGRSHYNLSKSLGLARTLFIHYSNLPLNLVQWFWGGAFGLCLIGLSVSFILGSSRGVTQGMVLALMGICALSLVSIGWATTCRQQMPEAKKHKKPLYVIAEYDG